MSNDKTKTINMNNKLGENKIPGLVIKMSIPMIIAMTLNGIYYLVDAAFIGLSEGAKAIAGLAVGFPIEMTTIALGTMIGIGSATLVSTSLGKNNLKEAQETVMSVIIFCSLLGIFISLILMFFKIPIFNLFGANKSILSYANSYYSIIIPGIILIFLSFSEVNMVRAEGNAAFAGIVMITGTVLNVILDFIFIFIVKMGTAGAALGTVIARFVTSIILFVYYFSGKSIINLKIFPWAFNLKICLRSCVLGFGSFTNNIGFAILAIFVNLSLKKYNNLTDLSVYGVLSRIHVFVIMPLLGLAQGFQAIASYNLGAKKINRIKSAFNFSLLFSIILGTILFLIFIFMPKLIFRLFTQDLVVINEGLLPLRLTMIVLPIIGIHNISYFYFISTHKPKKAVFVSLLRQVIVLIPLIIILPVFVGKIGLWIAYPVADIITIIICMFMVYIDMNNFSINVSKYLKN